MSFKDSILKILPSIGKDNKPNRDIWLKNTLKQIPSGLKILDVGAGELQYKHLCSHLDYTSQDFCEYDGKGDNKGIQVNTFDTSKIDIVSDITNIPLPDNSFDAIMCTEVLEHVPDPIRAFEEMNRLLKVDGYLVITAPFASSTHFSPYHFSTGFNRYFYEYILKNNYKIVELSPNGNFFGYIAQEIIRLPKMSEQYLGKKPNVLYLFVLFLSLYVLNSLGKNDNKSSEVLCYGYHLFARKIR